MTPTVPPSLPSPASAPALWQALAQRSLVRGDMPPPGEVPAPWYVQAAVGMGAWLAALCVLALIGLVFARLWQMGGMPYFLSLGLCAGAGLVLRWPAGGIFLRQFALAGSLAGQALLAMALLNGHGDRSLQWSIFALFEIVLVILVPDALHRTLAAFAACTAIALALTKAGAPSLYPVALVTALGVMHAASRDPRRDGLCSAALAGIGLAIASLVPLVYAGPLMWGVARHGHVALRVIAAVALALVWLVLAMRLARDAGARLADAPSAASPSAGMATAIDAPWAAGRAWPVAVATGVVAACAWYAPSVVASAALLVVAFGGGRRALMGLAILALLAALAHTYYSLATTLLFKSAALALTGAVLVAVGWSLRASSTQEQRHA